MPPTNPNRNGSFTRTVTGHWMHDDGSGPYAYDPIAEDFTLVVFGGDVGSVTVDNSGIHSRLGNVDSTTAAADDSSSGLNGLLKRALAHQSTLIGRTPALGPAAAAGSVPVVPVPTGARRSATIARPENITAYTANDVVGGVLTFAAVANAAGTFTIMGADLMWDFGALPSGMAGYTLHLYSVTPPSALADNAAWDLPSGDRASYIGPVAIAAPVDVGSTLFVSNVLPGPNVVSLGTGETALYGYLVTAGAYTPAANSETGSIRLRGFANA